ncbi:hypothetical protein LINPERPRIM_LOCUS1520 [Linum perenne]
MLLRWTVIFLSFSCLLLADAKTTVSSSNFLSDYNKFCHQTVPESPSTVVPMNVSGGEDRDLHFDIAYFTGGSQIFPKEATADSNGISLSFHPKRHTIYLTENPEVLKLQASLKFHLSPRGHSTWNRRNLRQIRFRGPRIPLRSKSIGFDFYGFWSRSTGELCMVGSGSGLANSRDASSAPSSGVVLKLKYPVIAGGAGNVSSLIHGSMESTNPQGSLNYFEPVSILALPHFGQYKYSLMSEGTGDCLGRSGAGGGMDENLRLEVQEPSVCLSQLYRYAWSFELEYGSECSGNANGSKCNPLKVNSQALPGFMTIQGIRCDDHGIRVLLGFANSIEYSSRAFGYGRVFNPNNMLIGEGTWDETENKLCVMACRVLNFNHSLDNASVGDCSTQFSLRFPKKLTIQQRSTVVGQVSSSRSVNDMGYFPPIGFHGFGNRVRVLPGLEYKYTVLDMVAKSCSEKKITKGKGTYPSAYSFDMRFGMSVSNSKGQKAEGSSSPLFVGEQFYQPYRMNSTNSRLLNVSYKISFTPSSDFKLGDELLSNRSVDISAEGIYDKDNGILCMIGCRHLVSHIKNPIRNETTDCQILITMNFSPLNSKGVVADIKGIIESKRGKGDPLYFGKLQTTSHGIYVEQAFDSLWRMDIEIILVLISNSLACIFIGLQLYHVSKYPEVLPFISFIMLGVLTLGHMIPLLLNFDAMFGKTSSRQNVFLGSGGWLEVNEVIVRVVTMVAFLLQFRLLQLTWSSRQAVESRKSLWLSERRVLYLSLPIYAVGGVIAWYAHNWRNSHSRPYLRLRARMYQQHYPWDDLKSYAGLILDGFLLPQIVFNLFLNSSENALSMAFYLGATVVRLVPHAYDLYRAHSSPWYLDLSYIYANHRQDFYSTFWNIVIPIGGLLFAAIIYLQQRFGGRIILPKRFRGTFGYEKVPTVNSEEMATYSRQQITQAG